MSEAAVVESRAVRARPAVAQRANRRVWLVLGAAVVVAIAACLHASRGMTWWYDDWNFLTIRRSWNADAFLQPHNQHLMLVTAILYKLSWATDGAGYGLLRVVVSAEHALLAVLLFVYARRRVGDLLALGAAVVLLFLGTGYEVILWPINTGFITALVGLLLALLCLDADSRRGDIGATLALGLTLASSSAGVAMFIGVAVEVLARGDRRSRAWVLAGPLVLYIAWRIGYHPGSDARLENTGRILQYGGDSSAGAAAALLALSVDWGRVLLVGLVALAVRELLRPAALTPRVLGLLAAPLAFWSLQALSRAQLNDPNASRYVYVGAFLILLLAAELGREKRIADRRALVLLGIAIVLGGFGGLLKLRDGGRAYRNDTETVRAELGAADVARGVAPPAAKVDARLVPQITLGDYAGIEDDIGRIGWSQATLRSGPVKDRIAADTSLAGMYSIVPVAAGATCNGPTTVPAGTDRPLKPGDTLMFRMPAGGSVSLRRFAPFYSGTPLGQVAPGQVMKVVVPRDKAPDPWTARLDAPGPVQVCAP